jgi:hypothetical protein
MENCCKNIKFSILETVHRTGVGINVKDINWVLWASNSVWNVREFVIDKMREIRK